MTDMVLLKCEYCGGTLEHKEGDLWCCQNCGTTTMVSRTPETRTDNGSAAPQQGFMMTVGHNGESSEYKVKTKAEFEIGFDRRATMADPNPTIVTLHVDGRRRATYEGLARTRSGRAVFETDDGMVIAYTEGKACIVRSGEQIYDEDDACGEYVVGGLSVMIQPGNRSGE
ncbi:hypothetical protein [Candidatus Methanoprimaticola sp. MG2]|uniref:hypothetical protein n=1 Tax=Candidatus Methanoprimaticola sp. MG2 TaxID=3228838 RepID=UPI0039C6D66A